MEIVRPLHAYLHCPKHRRPTNSALYIAPASLSVDVHPDEPSFRVELFGRAPSPASPTRRLNPDRLDHKADQLSRPVSPVRPNHPQAPQRSASPLPLPRSHGRRQHESIPLTSRTWRLLEHYRESPIHAASSAPQHHSTHGHPTANGPPSLHALWRATARAPCLVPSVASLEVCRGPPVVCA